MCCVIKGDEAVSGERPKIPWIGVNEDGGRPGSVEGDLVENSGPNVGSQVRAYASVNVPSQQDGIHVL